MINVAGELVATVQEYRSIEVPANLLQNINGTRFMSCNDPHPSMPHNSRSMVHRSIKRLTNHYKILLKYTPSVSKKKSKN